MRAKTLRAFRAAAAAAILLTAASAGAAGPQDQAAAVALFQEGRKLTAAGDHAAACPKFAEAQRLFPTAGTLLVLADCYEKLGKLASAWGAFKQAEITARNGGDVERQEEGARRAKLLEASLSKLTISVGGVAGAGIEVRRDGSAVGEGQWGTAVPVDAGEHVIEVAAPGKQKWTTKVQVGAGGVSVAVSVPELPPEKAAEEKPAEGSSWGAQRIAGVTIGAAGVVGLVVGSVFTAKMVSKNNESKASCLPSDPDLCYAPGVALRNEALDASRIATPTFIAGAITATAGLVVFLTAPRGTAAKTPAAAGWTAQPVIGPGMAGLHLRGVW
jgi:tetratricopeptide (TPR) repeat protein